MLEQLIVFAGLGVMAYLDLKTGKLPLPGIGIFGAVGICYECCCLHRSPLWFLSGMAVGGVVLLLAYISGERIGKGDGYLLCAIGVWMGFWHTAALLTLALAVAGVCSCYLLCVKKADRKTEIPFCPCMLVASLFLML